MPEQERRLEYMPLPDIAKADRNPKRHDKEGIDRSMRKFGVVELPALDERTGKLVAGHGRLDSWLDAYRTNQPPPGGLKIADDGTWLAPVIRGWASNTDEEASAYLVASNQLTINGGWDDRQLAELLEDISSEDATLLQVTGIDEDALDKLLSHNDVIGDAAGGFLADLRDPFRKQEELPPAQQPPGYDWHSGDGTGEPATGDLGPSSFDGDEPVSPAGPSAAQQFAPAAFSPAGTAAEYAPLSWVLHDNDRKIVRAALTHLQKQRDIATSASALVALCTDYARTHGLLAEDTAPLEGAAQ